MPFSSKAAVHTLLSALILATPLVQAGSNARDIASINESERARLPDTAVVTIGGKEVKMSELRAFHAERKQQRAQAAELGRSVARAMENQRGSAPMAGIPVPPSPPGKGTNGASAVPSVVGMPGPSTKPVVAPSPGSFNPRLATGKPILMEEKEIVEFAKDYQDFCRAAKATACVYLPKIGSWETDITVKTGFAQDNLRAIQDPLVTDEKVCKEGGGTMFKNSKGCIYFYPVRQTTNFSPSQAPKMQNAVHCEVPAQAGDAKIWNTVISPNGAARAEWVSNNTSYPKWLGANAPDTTAGGDKVKPATCVVQVFMAP